MPQVGGSAVKGQSRGQALASR
uniref:Uncharacterized protein n=1 Tax=Arundo donax TaxID=35708 RepID=A0A0A9DZ60_ARUDO